MSAHYVSYQLIKFSSSSCYQNPNVVFTKPAFSSCNHPYQARLTCMPSRSINESTPRCLSINSSNQFATHIRLIHRSAITKAGGAAMAIEWFSWLAEVGMQQHGHLMVNNHLEEDDIFHFDHDLLRSIGIDSAKDRILILNLKNKYIQRKTGLKKLISFRQYSAEAQSVIIDRVQGIQIDEAKILGWLKRTWPLCERDLLIDRGYLNPAVPDHGSSIITALDRTNLGQDLLNSAKDMLWAALYGTTEENVRIHRVERELLVITIPGRKAFVFNFLQSVTEVGALGSWRDPTDRSNDEDAPNMLLQVEYGESASEVVGDAIMVAIHVINLLEVNEVVLYARSSNIEQSTLSTVLYFEKNDVAAVVENGSEVLSVSSC